MNKHIILARYNEDVSWVYQNSSLFTTIYLVNKGEELIKPNLTNLIFYDLPNIGRESNTYLNFIVNFYDLIKEKSEDLFIFSQAFPFDVNASFISDVQSLNKETALPISLSKATNIENMFAHLGIKDASHPNGIPFINYYNHLFFNEFLNLEKGNKHLVKYSGIWAVKGENILFRDVKFYKRCLSMVSVGVNPFEGYIFERMWQYIFDNKTLDWISHNDKIREIYAKGAYKNQKVD
jgi:hypothetical protein